MRKIIPLIAGGCVAAMTLSWYFASPAIAPPPPVVNVLPCSEVIKTEDIRFVPLNPIAWEKTTLQKIAAQAPIPKQKPEIEPPKEKAKPKPKVVCRRGEKVWYWNTKQKRKMFRIRREC